jgi:ubiquinone biosynthesis protein Coq4
MHTEALDLSQRGAWPIARFGKLHDLHHVVLGIPPAPESEIELQAIILGTGHPDFFATLNVFTAPYVAWRGKGFWSGMFAFGRGVQRGRSLGDVFLFPYEDHWETPLTQVRAMLGIPTKGFSWGVV